MPALGSFSNGGMAFGVTFTLNDGFSGVSSRIQDSYQQLGSATDRIADRINNSFGKITGGIALMGTGLGLLAPILKGIDVAAGFETYEAQLTTLLGTRDAAMKALANIKMDAKLNPVFGTNEMMGMNTALIGTKQVDAERARTFSNAVAAAVAGGGGGNAELQRMGLSIQQSINKGAFEAVDLKEWGTARIPIQSILKEAGVTLLKGQAISFDMVEKALLKAVGPGGSLDGALERAAATTKGRIAQAEDAITFGFQAIGDAVKPVTDIVLGGFNDMMDVIVNFMNTPFGKTAIQIGAVVLAILALTIAGVGLVMVLQAVSGILGVIWAEIAPIALVLLLLVGIIWAAYEAINSTNGTLVTLGTLLLLPLGPLGWLIIAIMYVTRALRNFRDYMDLGLPIEQYSPTMQFFIKLGAILRAVGEMFKFSNAKDGIGMTEELTEKLRELGLLEFARDIGTWIVRLKHMWVGMKEGIKSGWGTMKEIFNDVLEAFKPLGGLLESVGLSFKKNTTDIEKWRTVGKWAGIAIMTILFVIVATIALLAVAWMIAGVAMLLAFLPIIVIVGVVIALIWGIVWVIQHFGEIWDAVSNWFVAKWEWAMTMLLQGLMWLWSIPGKLWDVGVGIVTNLWEGMKSMWDSMMTWLDEKISSMAQKIAAPFQWLGRQLGFGDEDPTGVGPDGGINPSGNTPYGNPGGIGGAIAKGKGDRFGAMQPTVIRTNSQTVGNIQLNNYLDGEKISSNVIDRQTIKKSRKNDDD